MKTKTALIFIFLSILLLGCSNSNTFDRTNQVVMYDIRDDLVPSRLTIAMWDFSWMYGHHPGGPFEDWSKALDELKERKFNTVRIDAFPLLIAELEADGKGVYTYPAKPMITWGQSTVACDHRMKAELVEFMRLTKEQGVYVILSSWGQGDRSKFTDRTKFWKAWETTLDLLKKDNLLDHVVYVDFDQEFPFFSPFQKELNHLAEVKTDASENQAGAMEQAGSNTGAWNKAQAAFVKEYFESTLAHFHEKYPEMRFTFSLTAFWNEVRAIKPKGMDVLELHIWIKGQLDKYTGFSKLKKDRDPANDYKAYMEGIRQALKHKDMLKAHMIQQLETAQSWANELDVPLTTTEAWGPWWHMDHPDLEWDWLYDWCEYSMGLSSEHDFWGATPWNFSHPYWDNWSNIAWYKKVNGHFLEH